MSLRIAVIGGGTAGQAAGLLLARDGHRVTIFERVPHNAPVGAGLLLQPTGLAVLDDLGLANDIETLATPIRRLLGTTPKGRAVMDIRYADLRPGLAGLGVQRAAIDRVMRGAIDAAGIETHDGVTITGIESSGEHAHLRDEHGSTLGPFDLAIAADGARSTLRAASGLTRRDRLYPWGALWFIGDDKAGLFGDTLRQVYRSTTTMLGFLPSGKATPDAPERVSMFWSVRTPRGGGDFAGMDLAAWKADVHRLAPWASPLFDQIQRPTDMVFAPYRDAVMRRTVDGCTVFIGDAAHAMSPQLGQGVNLALMDAASLAEAIRSAASIPDALRQHDRARRRHVAYYQFASRWLTPWFQSGLIPLAIARDTCMPIMGAFSPARRQMLLALAGVKTGLFTSMPLPPKRDQRAASMSASIASRSAASIAGHAS